jgi:hypothetical protein
MNPKKLPTVAFGLIVDVDLLFADVLLYYLLFLNNLLAQTNFLFYHRTLLDYELFLDYGYSDLIILLNRNAFDVHLLALFGDGYPLAHVYASVLTLAGAGSELVLIPEVILTLCHPLGRQLALAELSMLSIDVARRHPRMPLAGRFIGGSAIRTMVSTRSAVIRAVAAPLPSALLAPQPEVGVNLSLALWSNILIVVEV